MLHNVGSVEFLQVWGENTPTNLLFTGSGGEDPPPTVTSVGLASSLAGSDGYCGWVEYHLSVDSPSLKKKRENSQRVQW